MSTTTSLTLDGEEMPRRHCLVHLLVAEQDVPALQEHGVAVRRELLHLRAGSEAGKQSKKTLLDIFERYLERHMTLFDTI